MRCPGRESRGLWFRIPSWYAWNSKERGLTDPSQDGTWISEVIDDKLYLAKEDFHESLWERYDWLTIDMPNPDDEYQRVMQTGSKALYFAQCRDQNETWLPLLEKAYAKAHGDYGAIDGGWSVMISNGLFPYPDRIWSLETYPERFCSLELFRSPTVSYKKKY